MDGELNQNLRPHDSACGADRPPAVSEALEVLALWNWRGEARAGAAGTKFLWWRGTSWALARPRKGAGAGEQQGRGGEPAALQGLRGSRKGLAALVGLM